MMRNTTIAEASGHTTFVRPSITPSPSPVRTQYRTHAADHHHREYDDDDVRAHQRADLINRRRQYAGESC
jgi:hypothetical protein